MCIVCESYLAIEPDFIVAPKGTFLEYILENGTLTLLLPSPSTAALFQIFLFTDLQQLPGWRKGGGVSLLPVS
jgi:hypothetical protein